MMDIETLFTPIREGVDLHTCKWILPVSGHLKKLHLDELDALLHENFTVYFKNSYMSKISIIYSFFWDIIQYCTMTITHPHLCLKQMLFELCSQRRATGAPPSWILCMIFNYRFPVVILPKYLKFRGKSICISFQYYQPSELVNLLAKITLKIKFWRQYLHPVFNVYKMSVTYSASYF